MEYNEIIKQYDDKAAAVPMAVVSQSAYNVIQRKWGDKPGALPVVITNPEDLPGGGTGGGVASVNMILPDLSGDVHLEADDIDIDIDPTLSVSIREAISYLDVNKASINQLSFSSLNDVQYPKEIVQPLLWYTDNDKITKSLELRTVGQIIKNEARIKGDIDQTISGSTSYTEITFPVLANETQGDQFTKNGNGIQILNLDKPFKLSAGIPVMIGSTKWLTLPLLFDFAIFVNGIEITTERATVNNDFNERIIELNSEDYPALAVGDIITIGVKMQDSSGSAERAEYTLSPARYLETYNRDVNAGGYALGINDVVADRLSIVKTDTLPVPTSPTPSLLTFTPGTGSGGAGQVTFNALQNAFIFTTKKPTAWHVDLTLQLTKQTANDGKLELYALVEQYTEGIGWFQVVGLNNSRAFTVSELGNVSLEYSDRIHLQTSGVYRMRLYWRNDGAGTLSNANEVEQTILLSTGETLLYSVRSNIQIREIAIGN